jgi:serine/threonine protein kinase
MNDEQLFHQALELPAQQRAAFLDQGCAGDTARRRRVEALLQAHDNPCGFLQAPAVDLAKAHQAAGEPAPGPWSGEGPGRTIGPYKLLQKIGEGGFGMVYMAEQEHPVRRRVALKIIKPGMDSAQVLARFEAERQALALMDHQNIARVFDAGSTDGSGSRQTSGSPGTPASPATGQPYFAMELVQGVAITKYCDDNHLSPRERLELFVPVCQAVQHAHQKGIIHRDLKPSNILVTLYDGRPVPKVIDFGVAKAIEQRLTDRTMFTQYGALVGTLEYMAPEQAEMSALGVDTRSDIYSLGVLLYELLTGTTPLEKGKLQQAAFTEVLRMIKEDEPPRPSTRLASSATLPAVAAARKTEPAKLARLVRGELDWIVMKCLEKDRTRRYETANGLARDLQRYLANEPVSACPPSASYKLMKFARKYKKAFGVTVAFLLVLVVGAVLSIFLAVRATRAEAAARRDRDATAKALAQAEAISQFLATDLLGEAAPEQNARERKVTVEELLVKAARRIDNQPRFADQPEVEAALRLVIGNTFFKLGDPQAAEPHLRRAIALRRQALGPDHPDTLTAQEDLAFLLVEGLGETQEATTLARATWEARSRVLGPEHVKTLESLDTYCGGLTRLGRHAQAAKLRRQCLEGRRRVLGEDHLETLQSMSNLAFDLGSQGRYAEAEPIMQECLRLHLQAKALGPKHPGTLTARNNLAVAQWYLGQFAEAEATVREALVLSREVTGRRSFQTLYRQHVLARILAAAGKWDEAEQLARDTLAGRREKLPAGNFNIGRSLVVLGLVLVGRGKAAEAVTLLREAPDHFRDKADNDDWLAQAELGRGTALAGLGRFAEAEPLLAAAWPRLRADRRIPAWQKRQAVEAVAKTYEQAGKVAAAAAWRSKLPTPSKTPKP